MFKLISTFLLVLSCSFSANATTYKLSVLVVFDSNTISASSYKMSNYTKKFLKYLNDSMKNSGLDDNIVFENVSSTSTNFYLHEPIAVSTDNVETLYKRYESFANYVEKNKTPKGKLFYLQKEYKADVVIGLVKEASDIGLCGHAMRIPSYLSIYDGSNAIPTTVEKGAYNSVFIINYDSICLDDETIVPHEWGHTAGLFHGNVTDTCKGVDENGNENKECYAYYKNLMFDDQATGYVYGKNGVYFETMMADYKLHMSPYYKRLNRFSDEDSFDCNNGGYSCGSSTSSAVKLLKKYARYYAKRGDWYSNGYQII